MAEEPIFSFLNDHMQAVDLGRNLIVEKKIVKINVLLKINKKYTTFMVMLIIEIIQKHW